MEDTLIHYGVKGMKWGVRKKKIKGSDDYILKKGSKFGRIALSPSDATYDNKKYVSTSKSDHEKWEKYLGEGYAASGKQTFNIGYTAVKDIKVMSGANSGKRFVEMCLRDKRFANQAAADIQDAVKNFMREKNIPSDPSEQLSYIIAAQTKTGKAFANRILSEGYGAIEDVHGRNVSGDPLIIYDPEKNLKKTTVSRTKY